MTTVIPWTRGCGCSVSLAAQPGARPAGLVAWVKDEGTEEVWKETRRCPNGRHLDEERWAERRELHLCSGTLEGEMEKLRLIISESSSRRRVFGILRCPGHSRGSQ